MRRLIPTIAILLALLATIGCERKNAAYLLPNELVGFWTTDDKQYESRFVELYRAYVIIGTGSKEIPTVQAVNSVDASPEGNYYVYHVLSTDLAGTQYKMTLLYTPANGGELRFKHMEAVVWKRHTDSAEAAASQPSATQPKKSPTPSPQPKALRPSH